MQLVVLGAFFLNCPSPTLAQLAFLQRWFWVSSFTGRFASSNPSRDGYLVAEFRDDVSQSAEPSTLKNMRMDVAAEPFPATFDMRSARARTLLLVLLSLKPKDAVGNDVVEPWRRVAEHGPNAIGYLFATVENKELASSPANRILRLDMTDRSQAKNWLLKLRNWPQGKREEVLASHGIPFPAFQLLLNGNADEFLRQRRDHLIHVERDFMVREGVMLPPDMEAKPSAIDTE
jgi:hypothetical protein